MFAEISIEASALDDYLKIMLPGGKLYCYWNVWCCSVENYFEILHIKNLSFQLMSTKCDNSSHQQNNE